MTESEINIEAFKLVDLLTEEENNSKVEKQDSDEIIGISKAADLGKVSNMKIIQPDLYGNAVARYVPSKGKKIGLNPKNYKTLQNLCVEILSLEDTIAKYADNNFVEASCFDWVIDVYFTKQAKQDLLTYIKSCIESELDDYTFYFKIECLGISTPIEVGSVTIDRISQELLNKQYNLRNDRKPLDRKEFDKQFKDFINKPIASIQIRGLKDSADRFAREKVKLSLNAIKCFLSIESIQSSIQIFDVDYMFHNGSLSKYLVQKSNPNSFLNTDSRKNYGTSPLVLDKETFKRIKNEGFDKICEFLELQNANKLTYLVEDSINRLGEIISTRDWHERVVKIISFFESIIVPKTNTKSNGETYLKKHVLPKLVKGDIEKIKPVIRKSYETRDKFLHNRILNPIDINELYKMQKLSLILLLQLIDLNKKYSTVDEVLNYYEIRK